MKRPIKSLLGRVIFESGLNATLVGDAAVIVAFHRVQDAPDWWGLSTPVGMFERHCEFFRRHFRVVSLRELVDRLERGARLNRELAITFDDGYRDNFENAVPVLEKLSLPATFFVVSQWVGTDVVPWWDSAQGVRHPWMSWDQVRELHAPRLRRWRSHPHPRGSWQGHRQRGARGSFLAPGSTSERQLGAPVELFAYPYGGRNNLTEANRELVKPAGFRCCCSATGELTTLATDPFRLARVPISPWYASTHHFGLEVALRRSLHGIAVRFRPADRRQQCCAMSEATGRSRS